MNSMMRTGGSAMTAVLMATCLVAGARADLQIMPLGDSNTVSFFETPNGSYRYFLEQYFNSNSIAYNFVGSQQNGSGVLSDTDHEGHSGYRIQDLAALNIGQYSPDMVLLLAGTNNRGEAAVYANYKAKYDSLFNAIGNVPVVVATVPRLGPTAFNYGPAGLNEVNNVRFPLMNQVLYDIQAERSNVTVVDLYSAMNPAIHLVADDVHLNTAGQQLLANLFIQGMSIAVPEPSQVLMMLVPLAGLLILKGKRVLATCRTVA